MSESFYQKEIDLISTSPQEGIVLSVFEDDDFKSIGDNPASRLINLYRLLLDANKEDEKIKVQNEVLECLELGKYKEQYLYLLIYFFHEFSSDLIVYLDKLIEIIESGLYSEKNYFSDNLEDLLIRTCAKLNTVENDKIEKILSDREFEKYTIYLNIYYLHKANLNNEYKEMIEKVLNDKYLNSSEEISNALLDTNNNKKDIFELLELNKSASNKRIYEKIKKEICVD